MNDVGDLSIRIGLHCGPVVAGVIGRHRAQYDVWGDTVFRVERTLDREGGVNLPDVGRVILSGMTVEEAERALRRAPVMEPPSKSWFTRSSPLAPVAAADWWASGPTASTPGPSSPPLRATPSS